MGLLKVVLPVVSFCAGPVLAKDAFVFLGATGDNAVRPNGVWQGIFEAFTGGEFDKVGGVDIHVAMNAPHTEAEVHSKVNATLSPQYEELLGNPGWRCKTASGDCSVASFIGAITTNVWKGRDANAQAKDMAPKLKDYDRVTVYLSLPPFVFGSWSRAAVENWGEGSRHRVHVSAEKPFGTSLESADKLYEDIVSAGLPAANLHLVDHWLSFFMNRHLLQLRALVLPKLKMLPGASGKWDSSTFEGVTVVEYEDRGLEGRGGFFDGVGQVRDMVQSHLLQVMALSLADTATTEADLDRVKMELYNSTGLVAHSPCSAGQYSGWLLEDKLTYHPSFADATLTSVSLSVDTAAWRGARVEISTGKKMGATLYEVTFAQRGGSGRLVFELGAEEVGLAGVRVENWELQDDSEFDVPAPGFGGTGTLKALPKVTGGSGFILNYSTSSLYFPKPYAMMAAALLTRQYGSAFVSYPQCRRSWEIVTGASPSVCLDMPASQVFVYDAPQTCGSRAPEVCKKGYTVEHLYDVTFQCTPQHDVQYKDVSLYRAKCNTSSEELGVVLV